MEPWKVPRRETIAKERKVQMERERNDDKKHGTSNANRKLETELPVEHAWTSFGQYCDQPALGQLQPPLLTPVAGIVDTPLTRCPWQVETLHRETKRWRLSFVGIKLETQSDRSFFVQLPATERKSTGCYCFRGRGRQITMRRRRMYIHILANVRESIRNYGGSLFYLNFLASYRFIVFSVWYHFLLFFETFVIISNGLEWLLSVF